MFTHHQCHAEHARSLLLSQFCSNNSLVPYPPSLNWSIYFTSCPSTYIFSLLFPFPLMNITVFLPRGAMRKRGLCCRSVSVRPSVCLSVRLSVTFVYCIQTVEDIIKLLSRPGSTIILDWSNGWSTSKSADQPSAGWSNDGWSRVILSVADLHEKLADHPFCICQNHVIN